MIIIVRKSNIMLIALIFLLSIALYSLNISGERAASANNDQNSRKIILIDPGHGGEDPGAVSDYSGLKEKDVNLSIALKLKEMLENEDYKVMMTREEDKLEYSPGTTNIVEMRRQDLNRRKKMMDEAGAAIVVSLHFNKFPQTQYSGAQTFYPPDSPDSEKLAMYIQKSIRNSADPENTREALVKREQIIILKDLKTPTVVVECGFLSNENEEKKIAAEEYRAKLAAAIRDGIKKFFGEK